jgi:DNA-binding transcriptional LysR family regulator
MAASLSSSSVPREVATLRTLRIAKHFPFFLVVAEEQNLHRAAERLNIAQSALSRRIADLEKELGNVKLFERQARGVEITPAGRLLARDVREILYDIEETSRRVARLAHGDMGTLRLAFSEAMIRRHLLPNAIKKFRNAYPDVELKAFPLTSEAQRQKIRGGEVDIGFVIEEANDAEEFNVLRVGMDKFMLVLPFDHPLTAKETVSIRDLEGEQLIFPARKLSPRLFDRIVSAFDVNNVSPIISVEVNAVDIAYGLVAARMGLAIVTAVALASAPDDVTFRELTDLDLPLQLTMISRKSSEDALLANFAAIVEDELDDGKSIEGSDNRIPAESVALG